MTLLTNPTMNNSTNSQASQQQQPPLPQTAAFASNPKLRNINKPYLLANHLVPRRPAYSTSKVEVNMNNSQQNRDYIDRANFYLKYDPPVHQARLSDQTRLKTCNYVKNQNSNLVKTNHFNSIESIPSNLNLNQKSSRMKILKFFQETHQEEDILNRKSAFQAVSSLSQKNINEIKTPDNHHQETYLDQHHHNQQTVPSSSSGTASTTSSISSSTTSNCLSNSNSISASLSLSKSNEHIMNEGGSKQRAKPIPESIRSGSVSSARSIYELRLKSLNESNMQAIVNSKHKRLSSSGSAQKQKTQFSKPDVTFSSVKLDKNPRRRTHLSDNDYMHVLSMTKSNQAYKSTDKTKQSTHMSDSSKVLNQLLKHQSSVDASREYSEKNRMMADAQRRLSYHSYRNQDSAQVSKFQHRKSMCVESAVDIEDELILDDVNVDLDYEDDDIFGEEDEEELHTYSEEFMSPSCLVKNNFKQDLKINKKQNENACLNMNNLMTPNSSSTSASSSSSMISNSSDNGQQQIPHQLLLNKIHKNDLPFISTSISSGKSFISSTSSSSMSTSIHGKPPQPPKSPKSPEPKSNSIFNFNIPPATVKQVQTPPPLPSQSTQLTNLNKINFTINVTLQNFSHFDIQSSFFNYERVKGIKDALEHSINMRTGASAASRQCTTEDVKALPVKQFSKEKTNSIRQRGGINSISSILGSLEQSSSVDEASIAGDILKDEMNCVEKGDENRLASSLFFYLNDEKRPSIRKPKISISSAAYHEKVKLVDECPFFRLEIGGDIFKGLGLCDEISQRRMMKLNSINILDKMNSFYKKEIIDMIESNTNESFTIEFQDWGAYFYRFYFFNQDHTNYLGVDPSIGPCAISLKREKILIDTSRNYSTNTISYQSSSSDKNYEYAYRFIVRTADLNTLRGTILEEHINTKHPAGSKGLAHKEIVSFLLPELELNCMHLADSKVNEKLVKLDESCIIKTHKIGVLLCKSGQSTEEEMYNNRDSTPAFDEFLQVLGDKVTLKGFGNYRGVLDNANDTTGTHSIYTKFRDKEIMFHVSTLLPYSNNDRQQLTRKRHIGNDLVTIIFQEPGAMPFSPKTMRSHFQHVFIVVRAIPSSSQSSTQYSVAVSYSTDVPTFGPPLPKNPLFVRSKEFRDFLLAKIVNADSAGLKCEKFTQIKMRAQQGTLKELATSFSSKISLANCGTISSSVAQKFGLFNFGSVKQKKTRSKSLQMFNTLQNESDETLSNSLLQLTGCIFWNINLIEDFQYILNKNCYFGVSKQFIVAVDACKRSILLSIGCNAIIGWTLNDIDNSFLLYFDQGECVNIKFRNQSEMQQAVRRLESFTRGCKTLDLSLEKKDYGPLGFSIHHDGVVTEVEPYSLAYYRGLKQGTRIVKINDYFVIRLSHEKMIDILRKSTCLRVTFLIPLEDGTVRRGKDDSFSLYSYLSTCTSLNERFIDSGRTPPPPPQKPIRSINTQPLSKKNTFQVNEQPVLLSSSVNRILQVRGSTNSEMNIKDYGDLYKYKNLNDVKKSRKSSQNSISNQVFHVKACDENEQLKSSITSSNSYLSGGSNIHSEWTKLVQTASKAYEDAQRSLLTSELINPSPKNTCNYISTQEILENNPDIIKGIKNDFYIHREKQISFDELKDTFIQMQIELNQEKQEKQKVTSKIRNILKENLNLKQEVHKLKDENTKLMSKTAYKSGPPAPSDIDNSLKLINKEFLDLDKDSSV